MDHAKPKPGATFPTTTVSRLGGGELTLGNASEGYDWQLIVVYRGAHCPICTRYLGEVGAIVSDLQDLKIEVVAVSTDSQQRAEAQIAEAGISYPVGYGMSVEQMQTLGLYISSPRHGMNAEVPFAEPGLFLVNEDQELRMVDIANVPFMRPQVPSLLMGLRFMRGMKEPFPSNGTYAA